LENLKYMKASMKHNTILSDRLVLFGGRAGLSATSPRATAQNPALLRAFRYYPCRSFIVAIMLFITTGVHAQTMSLDSVLLLIDRNNPMLMEYDNRAKAFEEYTKGATSWMAPMVGAGTFMMPYPNQEVMGSDKGSLMFSIEQEIPNPAKLNANRNFLQSKSDVVTQQRAIQYNVLRAEAKTYYYQLLWYERKVNVLKESERIIQLMLKLGRIRYPYNQGSLGNIYKAEGRLSEVQNMILMTRGDIENVYYKLKSIANIPPTDSIRIDTTTVVDVQPLTQGDTTMLTARSDVKEIEQAIEVMRLNQALQKVKARPDFKIRFDHMHPIGDMPSAFTVMGMISIPIAPWSSRMYKAEVKGMQYDIEAMKRGREAVLIEARGMLMGMANQLMRMKQQLENYETKIIPALHKNYETLMLAYEENREQLPMVIDAWEARNMAQLEYLNKLEDYYLMIVRYEKELEK